MTEFTFTSPEGREYKVDGPEGATPEQAFKILQGHLGAKTESGIGIGEDLAKSAATVPGRIVAGVAGLPGDLYHLGLRALGDNLTPESNYGSNAIKKSLASDYEAQREPGRLLQKTADFAPAVIGGPGSIGAKLLTRAVVPAVASEGAGLLAGDGPAKPYAELAGALVGGVGGSMAAQRFNAMAAAKRAGPSSENLLKTASGQFDEARDLNVIVRPDFATNAAADMRASIKNYDPNVVKDVHAAVDRLEGFASSKVPALSQTQRLELEMNGLPLPAAKPLPVAMNEAELVRKQLVSLKTSPDASVRSAAKEAIQSLQKSQMGLTAADTLAGDAGAFTKLTSDAVGNWAAGKRSNTVMGKVALGDLNAATAGSGANEDNALRQAIKQLVRPVNNDIVPKASRLGFNQAEIDAMNKVARGTPTGNAARYLGKLAPTGSVSGVLSGGAGFAAAGPLGAIGLPAAGYLAKKIGDLSTKRAVEALDSLVRSRSPLAQQVAASLPPAIVNGLPASTKLLLGSAAIQPFAAQQPAQQRSY